MQREPYILTAKLHFKVYIKLIPKLRLFTNKSTVNTLNVSVKLRERVMHFNSKVT